MQVTSDEYIMMEQCIKCNQKTQTSSPEKQRKTIQSLEASELTLKYNNYLNLHLFKFSII